MVTFWAGKNVTTSGYGAEEENRLPAPALDSRPRGSPCGPISAQNVTTSGHVRASQTFLGVARRGNVFSRGKRYHVGPWGGGRRAGSGRELRRRQSDAELGFRHKNVTTSGNDVHDVARRGNVFLPPGADDGADAKKEKTDSRRPLWTPARGVRLADPFPRKTLPRRGMCGSVRGTPRAGVKGACPESILPPSLSFLRLQESQNPFERPAPGAKRYHVEASASPTPKAAWAPTCHSLRLQESHNPLERMGVARRGNVFSCASSHRMNRSKTLPRRATWPDVVTF